MEDTKKPEATASAAGQRGRASALRSAGVHVVEGMAWTASAAAPSLKRGAARFGDWLARIGWGKFFLLAMLLLVFGGIFSSLLYRGGSAVVIDKRDPADTVNVQVTVSPEGIRIAPPKPPVSAAPPTPPTPAAADKAKPPEAGPGKSGAASPAEKKAKGSVEIGKEDVRVLADRDGERVAVIIDSKGVRVEDATAAGAASDGKETDSIVIGPDVIADPDKAAEAVEAARERIEEIVSEQIDRQVASRTRAYREHSSDWFMTFVALLIVTAIIVKIVLGSKRKAETRAQAASATAAEESLKRQLAEAQLKMMQAQVEPHFLFNTLASVDYLIETDPSRASTMQKNLIQYLRAALPQMREGSTTLGKEIALCRSYLEILKVRMDDRLQYAITVPQGLASAQFPPMMLQSLVENAIKHGLEPKAEGGTLTIAADIADGSLRVTVADTGLGLASGPASGTGVGLANVRERLAALYAGRARLAVTANTPNGTIAAIEVPYALDVEERNRASPTAHAA